MPWLRQELLLKLFFQGFSLEFPCPVAAFYETGDSSSDSAPGRELHFKADFTVSIRLVAGQGLT